MLLLKSLVVQQISIKVDWDAVHSFWISLKWSSLILVFLSIFHPCGMTVIFFFLWSPPLLCFLLFCVSLLVWASNGKILSECLWFHNSFEDNFLLCFWWLYQFWYHYWLYRTRNIHLSLSAKICICFSQHHAALNVADPSKDCKHISDAIMNTDSCIHIIERDTHRVYYQRKHSCSPLSRCVHEIQITVI